MARRWTSVEEAAYREELRDLYVRQNRTIGEIALLLGIAEQTVFQRLQRLGIRSEPERKQGYLNRHADVRIPTAYTPDVAEFFGIMLGDGHVSRSQVLVTLGTKEEKYAWHVAGLIYRVFHVLPRIAVRRNGYRDVYLGRVDLVRWLLAEGLARNKVKAQVDIPRWVFADERFSRSFLRGFFDTDGSIYRLRHGVQMSFTNHSAPLLVSLREMLRGLGYRASNVSSHRVYLTKRSDLTRFFHDVGPCNPKHVERFERFLAQVVP